MNEEEVVLSDNTNTTESEENTLSSNELVQIVKSLQSENNQLREQITDNTEEASTEIPLVVMPPNVDNNLYLSGVAENVTLNDIYSVTLSFRNICFLFFLLVCGFCLFKAFKSIIYKIFNI